MKYTTWRSEGWALTQLLSLATFGCLIPLTAKAQVTPDGTTSTTVNQDGNDFVVEEGDRVGDNLFHSFDEFSVPTLGLAAFNNAGDIANIFSRVTGNSISSIDGLLSANGTANLFLINPNGIIFGENASLNLGGSFFASTADSLLFEGDAEFSAVDPQAAPLLEVSIPIGARFRDNPRDITIEQQPPGSADFDPAPSFDDDLFGLRVPDGKSFALAGGDITADGGGIVSVDGRIELGAVGEEGILGLDVNDDDISFNFPDDLTRANVSLTNDAGFLVSGSRGGNIIINANNISILEGGGIFGGVFNGLGSPNAQAGDINLNAIDLVTISNSGRIQNSVNTETIGNAGNINITARSLSLNDNAQISTETFGSGNAGDLTIDTGRLLVSEGAFISTATRLNSSGLGGNLTINASEIVELIGTSANEQFSSGLYATALGTGNGGELNITTHQLIVKDGAVAETSTNNQGSAGNLIVNASNSVELSGTSVNGQLSSRLASETFGSGDAKDIKINTQQLQIHKSAKISTSAIGVGNAGDILVEASDYVNITDGGNVDATSTSISSESNFAVGTGSGGNITIKTRQLNLENGSGINTSTISEGDAGTLTIDATDFLQLMNSSTLFTASLGGSGGDLLIETKNLSAQNNSSIGTIAVGRGNPGNLTIKNTETVNIITGSAISTSSVGIGSGGFLSIDTKNLTISDNAGVFTSTADPDTFNAENFSSVGFSPANIALLINLIIPSENLEFEQGNSGNLELNSTESINLTGGAFITTSGTGKASGGNLSIDTNRLLVAEGASIRTSTFANSSGKGGDLTITASELTELSGTSTNGQLFSRLTSETFGSGAAGNLNIDTGNLIISEGAFISTEARSNSSGKGGNLKVNATKLIELTGTSANEQSSSALSDDRGTRRTN